MGKEKMKGLWVCVKMILNQRAEVEIERQTSEKDVLLRYKRKKKKIVDTIYNDSAIFSFSYWTPSRCAKILIDNSATVPPASLFTFMTVSLNRFANRFIIFFIIKS